jgi:hypothetical protein
MRELIFEVNSQENDGTFIPVMASTVRSVCCWRYATLQNSLLLKTTAFWGIFSTSFLREFEGFVKRIDENKSETFRPSSSSEENLPPEYEKAESLGRSGDCRKYQKYCLFNVLDVFSKIL